MWGLYSTQFDQLKKAGSTASELFEMARTVILFLFVLCPSAVCVDCNYVVAAGESKGRLENSARGIHRDSPHLSELCMDLKSDGFRRLNYRVLSQRTQAKAISPAHLSRHRTKGLRPSDTSPRRWPAGAPRQLALQVTTESQSSSNECITCEIQESSPHARCYLYVGIPPWHGSCSEIFLCKIWYIYAYI